MNDLFYQILRISRCTLQKNYTAMNDDRGFPYVFISKINHLSISINVLQNAYIFIIYFSIICNDGEITYRRDESKRFSVKSFNA